MLIGADLTTNRASIGVQNNRVALSKKGGIWEANKN